MSPSWKTSTSLALALLTLVSSRASAQTPMVLAQANGETFSIPAGFTVEVAAAPPLVERPITADFDEQGRLYVADSSGSNAPVKEQVQNPTHRIFRLVDTDKDGRFDTKTLFADKMMFPEGTLWYDGSLYVSAPPQIWKLTDTNDDGVADRREVWFDGKTLTGCANDLHGPYLGRDGYIYWCKGAFAEQTYERPGKSPFVTRASHIFRRKADGTGPIEAVMTGGMDNPVDVVFTPEGERIFTTTFLIHPGGGQRDGLIHPIYGGIYGKVHDPIFAHPWTSPDVMPVLEHLGPAAPAGLTLTESDGLGPKSRGKVYASLFNLHKITRHVLEPSGSALAARTDDFLVSSDVDFHPTDVFEDADGSLLVVDTGGWYTLCCPTSQIQKPDVLGAIYRIRRTDAAPPSDPRGLELNWKSPSIASLLDRLADPRHAVRNRAIAALGSRGAESLPALINLGIHATDPALRRDVAWTLARIDHEDAREALRAFLSDPDPQVVQAALNIASLLRDPAARETLTQLVQSSEHPAHRRLAAECLGRLGNPASIPALLSAATTATDRPLEHAITYALIEIADPAATCRGLADPSPVVRRCTLTALDQMSPGQPSNLDPATLRPFLSDPDPALRRTAWWIAGRHPEWGQQLADAVSARLAEGGATPEERAELEERLAALIKVPAVAAMTADWIATSRATPEVEATILSALQRSGVKPVPDAWSTALNARLRLADAATNPRTPAILSVLRTLNLSESASTPLTEALTALADTADAPSSLRIAALAAMPPGLHAPSVAELDSALALLDPATPVAERGLAVSALERARLDRDQRLRVIDSLDKVGPMELDRLITLVSREPDDELAAKLLDRLDSTPAGQSARPDRLREALSKHGQAILARVDAFAAARRTEAAEQARRLDALLTRIPQGDERRGQLVFQGTKAACSTCHAIGYVGGKTGPDLSRIGQIRTERDLLEAILYPSVSFVRSYEPVLVATASGQVHNGILRGETADELILAINATDTIRIPRAEVEDIQPGNVSVMPDGLDRQVSEQDLIDLITFLKARR